MTGQLAPINNNRGALCGGVGGSGRHRSLLSYLSVYSFVCFYEGKYSLRHLAHVYFLLNIIISLLLVLKNVRHINLSCFMFVFISGQA